jgi:hypothetical protein
MVDSGPLAGWPKSISRQAGINAPDAGHHIIIRGIERTAIFVARKFPNHLGMVGLGHLFMFWGVKGFPPKVVKLIEFRKSLRYW